MDKRVKIEFTDNLNLNTLNPEEEKLNKIIEDYENKQVEEIEEIIDGMFDDVITSSIKN